MCSRKWERGRERKVAIVVYRITKDIYSFLSCQPKKNTNISNNSQEHSLHKLPHTSHAMRVIMWATSELWFDFIRWLRVICGRRKMNTTFRYIVCWYYCDGRKVCALQCQHAWWRLFVLNYQDTVTFDASHTVLTG